MSIAEEQFRQVVSRFASGVTIVSARDGEAVHGLTANAFCSVSLDPPLVLVCIDKHSRTHGMIAKSGVFAVNFLGEHQMDVAQRFARPPADHEDRFAGVPHGHAATGAPILVSSLGYLDCTLQAVYAGGDHTIFVGRVEQAELGEMEKPLLYFRSSYPRLPHDLDADT